MGVDTHCCYVLRSMDGVVACVILNRVPYHKYVHIYMLKYKLKFGAIVRLIPMNDLRSS